MRKLLLAGAFALLAGHAHAAQQTLTCQDTTGADWPASPQHPCPVGGGPYIGNGSLALSTVSVNLNTLTASAVGGVLPTRFGPLQIRNLGNTDAAICPAGGTCTCSENGVANTNGITVQAGQFISLLINNVTPATPTVVACSGTPTIEVYW